MAFVSLAIIALVAFASPFIASAIPGKPVPETVFLLVFGAVLGPVSYTHLTLPTT